MGQLKQDVLEEIVRRIVEVAQEVCVLHVQHNTTLQPAITVSEQQKKPFPESF